MSIQVLVATMNQSDHSLLDKMNIQTNAIVCNQCERNEIEEFFYNGHSIKWLSFNERGVGLNRNNALMRATADIVMFADDDMVYIQSYQDIVEKAFNELKDADVIIFDLKYPNKFRKPISKITRLRKKDCMRFGAARIAVRLSSIQLNGISFNLCFGGGATYSSGEDTLFLNECFNKNLKVYAYPVIIAQLLDERESTWFKGYNDKFFFDKGILYYLLNRHLGIVYAIYHCFKHRKRYQEYGWKKAFLQMTDGINYIKKKKYKNNNASEESRCFQ